jgi:hypothetical protein
MMLVKSSHAGVIAQNQSSSRDSFSRWKQIECDKEKSIEIMFVNW